MTATLTLATRAACAEVYDDLKPLVEAIARRHARKYGCDPDETLAAANLHFLEAYNSFDPTSATSIEQRVQFIVERRLFDEVRAESRKSDLLKRADVDLGMLGNASPSQFDRDEFEAVLSDDARAVLGLLLDTPADLLSVIKSARKPGPSSVRKSLRRYCRDVLGWAAVRIADAFDEMAEALT